MKHLQAQTDGCPKDLTRNEEKEIVAIPIIILVLRFSGLEFNVQLRLSGVSRIEYRVLNIVSTHIAFAIFRMHV
jgi:hypothetical protein